MANEQPEATNEATGVVATNGTLCSSEASAAVVRHMFITETYYYRSSKALAYTLGAWPINFFVSLNKTKFRKEIEPVLERCEKPKAEENAAEGAAVLEEAITTLDSTTECPSSEKST